ncbi:MAG: DUF1800 domain-containing protein [Roseiflexaceae bacterium]|nr:DUF1800 domain-containing protein [Roseiflexaceae bacterium]
MTTTRRDFLRSSGLAAAYLGIPAWLSGCAPASPQPVAEPLGWADDATATLAGSDPALLHLLQRLTYGPAPGDLAHANQLGAAALVDEQLHPERIDDSALERRLAGFDTLTMSSAALIERFGRQGEGPQEIMRQLQQASLLRAVYSKRQLQEIMVDVWSNHLNIYLGKGQVKWLKTADDRDVIRPHALGKFRDLLLASAKSPAMLVYLDNVENTAPGARQGKGGLNENYARELLELHTLGADASYDHDDIIAVARVFTGWSIARPQEQNAGSFVFRPRLHDSAAKQIDALGLALPAGGGVSDGETLLARLASDPRTAKRIAHKLCARFVGDAPPAALVERAAQTYLASDTDIRATLELIFRSEEFAAAAPKLKLPTHALASMLRALGAQIEPSPKLVAVLQQLGQPFFGWPAPDGYPQVGAAWINTGGMLARWNVAFALAEGRGPGVAADLRALLPIQAQPTAAGLVDAASAALLHQPIGSAARSALVTYAGGAAPDKPLDAAALDRVLPGVVGLVLASPLFQLY